LAKGNIQKLWIRTKIIAILLIFLGFGAIIAKLFLVQIVQGEELKSIAINQSLRTLELTPLRGTIYDRTGEKELAKSSKVWTVALEPMYIGKEKKDIIVDGLSDILEMDKEVILEKANQKLYFTYLKQKVEIDVREQIIEFLEENKISQGVRLIDDYKRYYPYGTTASVVLGYTGNDNNGLSGIEYQYNAQLSGTSGRLVSAKNALGTDMPFQYEQLVPSEKGYDLVLTIDETVQSILDKYIKQGIEQYVVANGAVAIVMDVKTGAILGLSSQGEYDPNQPFVIHDEQLREEIEELTGDEYDAAYMEAVNKQWRNKAVSDTYYPGSVFKMCVSSMGIEEGIITDESSFYCTGVAPIEGYSKGIKCWKLHGHGTQTFFEGLSNSCNPYFINVGQQLGPASFFKYFDAFGFTELSGVDLPGETLGIYHSQENLNPVELATESMGQNFGITGIQMISAACAVANGGYLVQPHIVDRIIDSDGNIVSAADTSYKRQVISEETSKKVTEGLQKTVEGGSASNGYVKGYRISGKTGTSEKMSDYLKNPEKGKQYIASLCGFAPAEDPQYALLVFFDEPKREVNGGYYGGNAVAGPIFSSIMSEILPYLGVKSEYTEEEFNNLDTNTPNVTNITLTEAYKVIGNSGLAYKVIGEEGDGEILVSTQIPQIGSPIPKGGTVVLYTSGFEEDGDTEVPDFVGGTLADSEYLATLAGVQIRTNGTAASGGTVLRQSVRADEKVKQGTVIELTFIENVVTDVPMG